MKVLIDADACPVVKITEDVAKKYSVPVVILCDTNHCISSDYSTVKIIGAGADAVDFALVKICESGDIVVTQDYGVAAMTLGKGAYSLNQNALVYTNDNIDGLLMDRYVNKKARMASKKNHIKGPAKRTKEADDKFANTFEQLILSAISKGNRK